MCGEKVRARLDGRSDARITPACAGKSAARTSSRRCWRDHPRVRGEKGTCTAPFAARSVSPPRVRGKERDVGHLLHAGGITPACAGKSACGCTSRCRCWDHPRVCGEKSADVMTLFWTGGSPPRVRGKDGLEAALHVALGITPACAGKSRSFCCEYVLSRDHPRVCGEKCGSGTPGGGSRGSPPRVRGKGKRQVKTQVTVGITPACAGKSWPLPELPVAFWDHPRVCGEKVTAWHTGHTARGSPPRVRGKDDRTKAPQDAPGITPACAGKSSVCHGRRRER